MTDKAISPLRRGSSWPRWRARAQPPVLARDVLVSFDASPHHFFLNLLENLGQAVGRRGLQRWERPVAFKFLQLQRLANGNDVPVVDISGHGSGKCAAQGGARCCSLQFVGDRSRSEDHRRVGGEFQKNLRSSSVPRTRTRLTSGGLH